MPGARSPTQIGRVVSVSRNRDMVGLLVMRRACSSQAVQDPGMKKESSMAITTHL